MQETFLLASISIILFFIIFYWVDYLFDNNIIREAFDPSLSYTVDQPLNITYSCKNFCGPTARCAVTGEQCTADIECPGCQPNINGDQLSEPIQVPFSNDAGKLTTAVPLNYSPLTFGYGTRNEKIIPGSDLYPPQADFGENTWQQKFIEENNYYETRYSLKNQNYQPVYTKRPTTTGLFSNSEPLPSNF
jgi:hypothetical protein